jgi:glycosyltransferase involved in cell wall biosynthesis
MLGIAIPCYKYHIPVLKRCLQSIEEQTVKPDYVVVSCSSSFFEDINHILASSFSTFSKEEKDIPSYKYSFPLIIINYEGRLNAAQNRNRAAVVLQGLGCDYISFFDCDDVMLKGRIEAIKKAIQTYPLTQIIMHGYLTNNSPETILPLEIIPNVLQKAPSGCAVVNYNWNEKVHHSQVTVTKEVLQKFRFREEAHYERKEDAVFCGDVLEKEPPNVFIKTPLSIYYEEGQWFS